MKNRSVFNSPRLLELKRKRRRSLQIKMLIGFFCIVFILGGLSFLSRVKKVNINEVHVSGNTVVDTEMIKQTVDENISGYYVWIFPKSNFLLYPKTKIERELAQKFKRLKNISINVNNLHSLDVSVSERTGLYTWCGVVMPVDNALTPDKCYFLDENGYVFDQAPYFSGEVYLKFYGSLTPQTENPPGSYYYKDNFGKLVHFTETLKIMGLNPVMIYHKDDGDFEIYLSKKDAGNTNPKIILKDNSDLSVLAENLQAALSTDPLKSDFKNKYGMLQYIDLRFGNKVFYKFGI